MKKETLKPTDVFTKTFKWNTPDKADARGCIHWYCSNAGLENLTIVEQDGKFTIEWRGTPSFAYLQHKFTFESRDAAATTFYQMLQLHKEAVAKVPIPTDLEDRFKWMISDLQENEKAIRTLCFNQRYLYERLRLLAKDLGSNLSYDPNEPINEVQKAIQDIDKFKLMGDDTDEGVPFFSEHRLYELVGKEDARTILALLHHLKRLADPVKGE